MIRKLFVAAGALCIACAAAPLFWGIFNHGSAALLVLGVVLLAAHPLYKKLSRRPVLRGLLTALFCTGIGCMAVLSAMMFHRGWLCPPPAQGAAVVVVPGAKVTGTQPTLMLRRRLDKAASYLAENPEATCIVTGGQGADEEYPEADVMAWYLQDKGVAVERILIENTSTNTRENFVFSAHYIEAGQSVVIATDGFHQMRSYQLASAAYKHREPAGFYATSSFTPWGLFPMYWMRDMGGVPLTWLQVRLHEELFAPK